MDPLTRTNPAVVVLDVINHKTGEREDRVATAANVIGLKIWLPDGTEDDLMAAFTVPEPGRIQISYNLTLAGMHEVVAMLSYGSQTLPTSVFRFLVRKDRFGEVVTP